MWFFFSKNESNDGAPIDRVPAYKYIGIWIDDKQAFEKHIDLRRK
jgi:hypothetical protein